MARDGSATREKILEVAQNLVLEFGFGGMSVDQVINSAGITKGAFFHHFKSKNDLARALLDRYVRLDEQLLRDLIARAENLSPDPLHQYLVFVGLLAEAMKEESTPSGCLVASYVYQLELFNEETQRAVAEGFQEWERVLVKKIDTAISKYPPKTSVTGNILYQNLMALFEGGVIMAKLYGKGDILASQIGQHKNYIELLFGVRD